MGAAALTESGEPPAPNANPPRRFSAVRWPGSLLERGVALVLWCGVLISAVLLAIAWFYPQDLRETNRLLMLLNCAGFMGAVLQYHIGLACLGAAVYGLLMRRWRLLLVSALLALPATVPEWLTYRAKSPPPLAGQALRIASLNVLFINFSPHYILAEVDRIDADVLLVQEWHNWHELYLVHELSRRYPHHVTYPHTTTGGMAIFSRRPFLEHTPDKEDFRLSENGMRLQRIVIDHEARPLAIYNVHPVSPGRLGSILWNQRQTAELLDHVAKEQIPVILAGDFNAHTHTANMDAIRDREFVEAHEIAGRGRGDTWLKRGRVRHLPGFRIDHIFVPEGMTATRAEVGRYHGSDHLGVFADVGWRQLRIDE